MEPAKNGSGQVGRKTGEAPILAGFPGIRGVCCRARQPAAQLTVVDGQSSHGVKSVPKAGKGTSGELGNPVVFSPARLREMIEATDDRRGRGRGLRSSPKADHMAKGDSE